MSSLPLEFQDEVLLGHEAIHRQLARTDPMFVAVRKLVHHLGAQFQFHPGQPTVSGAAALTPLASLMQHEAVGGLATKIPAHGHLLLQAI